MDPIKILTYGFVYIGFQDTFINN